MLLQHPGGNYKPPKPYSCQGLRMLCMVLSCVLGGVWCSCRVTGLTLSKEQLAEATARVSAAGLSDKVTLLFCDYR